MGEFECECGRDLRTKMGLAVHKHYCPLNQCGTGGGVVFQEPSTEQGKTQEKVTVEQFIPFDKNDTLKDLIPSHAKRYIPQTIVGGTTDVEIIKKAIEYRKNVLLIGETGTGKTHCSRSIAVEFGIPYMRVNLNGGTTVEDLVGQWIPHNGGWEWSDGVLTKMLRYGGLFVCDELNAANAEILFILHSILDDERKVVLVQKDGEVVQAHKDFVFIATMNPSTYEGTKPLNLALFDRFDVILEFKDIAKGLIKDSVLMDVYRKVQTALKDGNVQGVLSPRGILQFQQNRELFGSDVAKMIMLKKFEGVGREAVEHILEVIGL